MGGTSKLDESGKTIFCLILGLILGVMASAAFMADLAHLLIAVPIVVSGIGS